jgi:hypothetical protein
MSIKIEGARYLVDLGSKIHVNFVGTFTVAVRVVRDDAEAFVRLPSNGEVVDWLNFSLSAVR